jgi:hypothetical protein
VKKVRRPSDFSYNHLKKIGQASGQHNLADSSEQSDGG